MYRKNALSDAKNNTCTANESSVVLSQESTSSSTNAAITENTIPSPHSYSWSPALYQHARGNYHKIKIIYFV